MLLDLFQSRVYDLFSSNYHQIIKEKLENKAKKKECWIQSIRNHMSSIIVGR